jgi:hypothetical protein
MWGAKEAAGRKGGRILVFGARVFRQAEINNFHGEVTAILANEHDVRRLDVAMDQALLLRCTQGTSHLRSNLQRHQDGDGAFAFDIGLDRLSIDKFHRIEIVIALSSEMENGRDIWMAERRGSARLAQKPLLGSFAVQVG